MVELIITVATLAVVIMAWGKISKAIDWSGARIGETTDTLSHMTKSATKQTARALVISDSSLQDTLLEEVEKSTKRVQKRTKLEGSMSAQEKKDVEARMKALMADIKG